MASSTAGLILTISGRGYALERTDMGWRLTTSRGVVYRVLTGAPAVCDCPAGHWGRIKGTKAGPCKHVQGLMDVGLLGGGVPGGVS